MRDTSVGSEAANNEELAHAGGRSYLSHVIKVAAAAGREQLSAVVEVPMPVFILMCVVMVCLVIFAVVACSFGFFSSRDTKHCSRQTKHWSIPDANAPSVPASDDEDAGSSEAELIPPATATQAAVAQDASDSDYSDSDPPGYDVQLPKSARSVGLLEVPVSVSFPAAGSGRLFKRNDKRRSRAVSAPPVETQSSVQFVKTLGGRMRHHDSVARGSGTELRQKLLRRHAKSDGFALSLGSPRGTCKRSVGSAAGSHMRL